MGEFHDTVSTLLEAFAKGISIVKAQKKRRRRDLATSKTSTEAHLSKSLKRNRRNVKDRYQRDLAEFGTGFADGDAESRLSLSKILSRLTAGFFSVIERVTMGASTSSDYQTLLNLSTSTRNETIQTFDLLSKRLSSSSLALAPMKQSSEGSHRKHKAKRSKGHHTPARSTPDLSIAPVGWVRPKPNRRRPSKSKSLGSIDSKTKNTAPSKAKLLAPQPSSDIILSLQPPRRQTPHRENRKSFMSFASDSTKLGEIPEHKWTKPHALFEDGDFKFPVTTYYPLEPYQDQEKKRARFMRLFRRE